jgi:hypothetical protein
VSTSEKKKNKKSHDIISEERVVVRLRHSEQLIIVIMNFIRNTEWCLLYGPRG